MGCDCGKSFSFDFEPNGIPFGSENRKENCHHNHIPFNVTGNENIVFSVHGEKSRAIFLSVSAFSPSGLPVFQLRGFSFFTLSESLDFSLNGFPVFPLIAYLDFPFNGFPVFPLNEL